MFDWSTITGFDWDAGNVSKNERKHGVECEEAESVFAAARVLPDEAHSTDKEPRWHAFGRSKHERALSVSFTVRTGKIRVISARRMNQRERKIYGFDQK